MENLTTLNTVNDSWGWFIDIEAPLSKSTRPKYYYYKGKFREVSRTENLNNLSNFEEEEEPNNSRPSTFGIICYVIILIILYIYLL